MQLPFTLEQFLDVFERYNRAHLPAALLLWLTTLAVVVLLVRHHARAHRILIVLLAIQWAWAGAAYHLALFRSINPAATLFGVLFIAQAVLFGWWGLRAPRAVFVLDSSVWSRLGLGLIAYSLIYPFVGMALGLHYPRLPTFGVPCPTTLLTVGALLLVRSDAVRWLGVIPLAWTVVGGSAAILFDVRADLLLPISGALLLVHMVRPQHGIVGGQHAER